MHDSAQQPHIWIVYGVMVVAIFAVLAFRVRRMSRERPLHVNRLWIVPALYSLFALSAFSVHPPGGEGWAASVVALVIGAALGWQRGRMMRITCDPQTGKLVQKASPLAIIFIVVLILGRSAFRLALDGANPAAPSPEALVVTDVLVAFALGLFAAQRVEMYLRAKRLLAATPRPVA